MNVINVIELTLKNGQNGNFCVKYILLPLKKCFIAKNTELYTLNGWTAWYENYISIKTFKKTQTYVLSQNPQEAIRNLHF